MSYPVVLNGGSMHGREINLPEKCDQFAVGTIFIFPNDKKELFEKYAATGEMVADSTIEVFSVVVDEAISD